MRRMTANEVMKAGTVLKVKRKSQIASHILDQTVFDFLRHHKQYEATFALKQQQSPFCENLSQTVCWINLESPDCRTMPQSLAYRDNAAIQLDPVLICGFSCRLKSQNGDPED